jgi:hypothetical protein
MFSARILQVGVDELEGTRQRDAETAGDSGQHYLGLLGKPHPEWRPRRHVIEDGREFEFFIDRFELADALPQALVIGKSEGKMTLWPLALAISSPQLRRS